MKKFNTDLNIKGKSQSEILRDKMNKRLNRAKQQAKKKEEEHKFRKSEVIAMKADLLEKKISQGDSNKAFDKIKEESEDVKET